MRRIEHDPHLHHTPPQDARDTGHRDRLASPSSARCSPVGARSCNRHDARSSPSTASQGCRSTSSSSSQIKRSIALGVLAPGEQLPTVKQLATTIDRQPEHRRPLYRELERDGMIETSPGRGSFVRGNGSRCFATGRHRRRSGRNRRRRERSEIDRHSRRRRSQLIERRSTRWYPAERRDGRHRSP